MAVFVVPRERIPPEMADETTDTMNYIDPLIVSKPPICLVSKVTVCLLRPSLCSGFSPTRKICFL